MARLQLKNLEKDYGAFRAVHGINLDVEDGEFMVLVAPPAAPSRRRCA